MRRMATMTTAAAMIVAMAIPVGAVSPAKALAATARSVAVTVQFDASPFCIDECTDSNPQPLEPKQQELAGSGVFQSR